MIFFARFVLSLIGPPWQVSGTKHRDFIFILGAGRSGNTLLRRLLMENAYIYIPPETYVLPMIARLRWLGRGLPWSIVVNMVISAFHYHPEFKWVGGCDLSVLAGEAKNWPKAKRKVDLLLIEIYRAMASFSGSDATVLGDKTPLNTLHLRGIGKLIPGAKYIYIYRDGADVVDSYVRAGIYRNYIQAAKRWVDSVNAWKKIKGRIGRDCYAEVRYEELARRPEQVIENLIDALSLPKRNEAIGVLKILGDATSLDHHANVVQPPSPSSIGKGRKNIPKDQVQKVAKILNKELIICGYEALK
jgi:hypothetical protein